MIYSDLTSTETLEGQIVIPTLRSGSTDIFLVDIKTGDAVNLTNNSANNRYGVVSADGKLMIFTSDRDGEYNVYVMHFDTNETKQLTFRKKGEVCYMPSLTNDCKTIVFGMHGEKPLMASISVQGGDINIIGIGHDPAVSPDGNRIAYTNEGINCYFVSTCNFDGSDNKQITFNPNTIGGVFPVWSPDGRVISYTDMINGKLEIFKCKPDGSHIKQLTHLNKFCTPSAWSPDCNYITFRVTETPFWIDPEASKRIYSEKKADTRPIWIMGSNGENPHVIEPLHYQCSMDGSRPNWVPQKKKIMVI